MLILTIAPQGTKVRENQEVTQPFNFEAVDSECLNSITCDVTGYCGSTNNPKWTDTEPGTFSDVLSRYVSSNMDQECFATLCRVYADTSKVSRRRQQGPKGHFYRQEFRVVLFCGTTELKAQISWVENVSLLAPARRSVLTRSSFQRNRVSKRGMQSR